MSTPIIHVGLRTCQQAVEQPASDNTALLRTIGATGLVPAPTLCRPCGNPGKGYEADLTGLSRGTLEACYCAEHGGHERAIAEIESDWLYVAPACVGDYDAVLDAGCAGLQSPDVYIVLREQGIRWLAYLGLGTFLRQLRMRDEPRLRANGRPAARGLSAADTKDEALTVALAAWRERVDARVEHIREMRGGTLTWGCPVEPRDKPIVLDATAANAWSLAKQRVREGREGIAALTGLRPSGEVL